MIIGIDGNEANVEKKVGVSVYTFELLNYFHKNSSPDNQFITYLKNDPRKELPKPNRFFKYKIIKASFLWSQVFLPVDLYLNRKVNVFFSPAHYGPRFCPVSTVVTIHDLSYFYYPDEFLKKDLYQLKNWTKYTVAKAKKIIAVSKTTKKDLMKFYDVPEDKIEVIYNGYRENIKYQILNIKIKNIKKPFILYVGTVQPRKNLTTLIEAFHLLLKEKPEYFLVIVGKKGWLYEEIFNKVKELNLKNKVIFTGYLEEQELGYVYQNASLFVLPSFYEGFGIPILEAMNFNCPVISSFTSSLPEIGGDACLYFEPSSSQDLKNKMLEFLENEQLRKELVKKGKERVKLFSWEKCGEETLEVIKSTIEEPLRQNLQG